MAVHHRHAQLGDIRVLGEQTARACRVAPIVNFQDIVDEALYGLRKRVLASGEPRFQGVEAGLEAGLGSRMRIPFGIQHNAVGNRLGGHFGDGIHGAGRCAPMLVCMAGVSSISKTVPTSHRAHACDCKN
ncbi:hypothetical protein [Pandoraea oxalativorans]|uniref:hypothetical protein n=1 Tax=Pandoraea oxalativorans TaxID=573737 RepID=UPI001B80CAF4|nr:hypothetical protein [Pandoraea oxalativorans]